MNLQTISQESELAVYWKNGYSVAIFQPDIIVKFFWRRFVFLVKFSYWSKFHFSVITGSRVMTISFCKGFSRNLKIGNTYVWVLRNIWRLGQVRNTIFGMNVSNKMLLKVAKCQGYSYYCFWVIKGKPTGTGVKLTPVLPTTTQIRKKGKNNAYFL